MIAINELRQTYPLSLLLNIAALARSTFYYHLERKDKDKYGEIKEAIKKIYAKNKGRYGYRRITAELKKKGYVINHKTVLKLMRECGVKCQVRLRRYKSYKGENGKIASNLLERNFHADKPNQKWVTDVSEFSVAGEKLYLSPILDLYNGEIISYNLSRQAKFIQITNMLDKAFRKIPNATNLILHSDQGWQYQIKAYQERLKKKGIRQSMSRKGNCLDNAVVENFFGLLKSEVLYLQKFTSIDQLKKEIDEYIIYYNTKRIKLKLDGLSPVQYRKKYHP